MNRSCADVRGLVSAEMDGEAGPAEVARVRDHLAACADCSAWAERARWTTRRAAMSEAPAPVDVTAAVLADLARVRARRPWAGAWWRTALVSCGLVQIYVAVVGAEVSHGHTMRDLGAFDVALGVAVLAVAARPWRAGGLLPLLLGLSALLLVTGGSDLVAGRTSLVAELPHLLVVGELLVVWQVRRTAGPAGIPPAAPPDASLGPWTWWRRDAA